MYYSTIFIHKPSIIRLIVYSISITKTSLKELRFAISLPFSAAGDAENGRLSATSFCHAPALSADAPSSVMLPA
jgi:hypothetical protein